MRRLVPCAVVVACAVLAGGSSAARDSARATAFVGYGFDTCTAPSTAALAAWQASPYRAVGIYIGGVNRACGDGNLSAAWVSGAVAAGWSLLPLYVGLQAPCVAPAKLVRIDSGSATTEGLAAAQDAIGRASVFGIPPGSPIYFDMEGYKSDDPACSGVVQTFLSGWVSGLRAAGFVAGVYGSAASTIRDLVPLSDASRPDAVWIANWNGQQSVFGDPYVTDSLWVAHQRVHQYKGGHKETYGGVTLNIDSNYADGPVVAQAAPPPAPPAPPTPPPAPAGSVGSGDGQATASWPDGAFAQPAVVTLTPATPTQPVQGFGSGGYAVQLVVTDSDSGSAVTRFAAPLTIHLAPQGQGLVPAFSVDGTSWQALARLTSSSLPAAAAAGSIAEADGSIDVLTTVPGFFGVLRDATPPSSPAAVSGRLLHGSLRLSWSAAADNGAIASYRVTRGGKAVLAEPQTTRRVAVRGFDPHGPTVFRVLAVDAAGNAGPPSRPLVVVPAPRPEGLPRVLPHWAWPLLRWQQHGRAGPRPALAPKRVPRWYLQWSSWRRQPFRLKPQST